MSEEFEKARAAALEALADARAAIEALDEGAIETNIVSAIGDEVRRTVMRRVLLDALRRRGWNLSRTAMHLLVAGTPAIARMIDSLGLRGDYVAAYDAGETGNRGRHQRPREQR